MTRTHRLALEVVIEINDAKTVIRTMARTSERARDRETRGFHVAAFTGLLWNLQKADPQASIIRNHTTISHPILLPLPAMRGMLWRLIC